jgi:hypothetical protein
MDLVVSREWLLVSSYERCRQFILQRFGAVHRFAARSFGLELSCRIGFCDYDKSHDLAQQAAAVHNTQGINSNESGSPYRQEVHTAKGTATKTPTISAADQFPSVMPQSLKTVHPIFTVCCKFGLIKARLDAPMQLGRVRCRSQSLVGGRTVVTLF